MTYILLCGYPPFQFNESDNVLFKQILRGAYKFDSPAWDDVSKEAKDFVANLMTIDQSDRMSAVKALKHDWIQGKAGKKELAHVKVNLEKTKASKNWKKVFNAVNAGRAFSIPEKPKLETSKASPKRG